MEEAKELFSEEKDVLALRYLRVPRMAWDNEEASIIYRHQVCFRGEDERPVREFDSDTAQGILVVVAAAIRLKAELVVSALLGIRDVVEVVQDLVVHYLDAFVDWDGDHYGVVV